MRSDALLALTALLLLLLTGGCRSLTLSISENNPPVFSFSASRFAECCRHLDFLTVYEVPPENQNLPKSAAKPKENIVLWQIWPSSGTDNSADGLPEITYGKVPPGFFQKIPADGLPPQLVEGKVYEVGGPPVVVPNAYLRFTIRKGKVVQLPITW
jgi:hypothetical protein